MEVIKLIKKQKSKTKEEDDEKEKEVYYDLTGSLHTQLLLFKFQRFIEKNLNPVNFSEKANKLLLGFRFVLVIIYCFLIFLEKPIHCYSRTTFYRNKNKEEGDNNCDNNLQFMYTPLFINIYLYRTIELLLLGVFIVIQLFRIFKSGNKFTTSYKRMEYTLIILITICMLDIIFGMSFDYFPIVNFFLRVIIVILLVKKLRKIWIDIIYLFISTWNVFFLMFIVIICFGILGYFLFDYSEDFSSVLQSIYSLYILLTTCNFPDVMLGTFTIQSKKSIIFFIVYIIINYFLIFSLLKSLYYSDFFEVFKMTAKMFIDYLLAIPDKNKIDNNKLIDKILNIRKNYLITDEEYKLFINLVNDSNLLKNKNLNEQLDNFLKIPTFLQRQIQHKIVFVDEKLEFLSIKYVELIIDLIDLLLVMFLFGYYKNSRNAVIIIQLIWCILYVIEFILYFKEFGKKMLKLFLYHTLFYIMNGLTIICLFLILIFNFKNKQNASELVSKITKPIIILRCIRLVIIFQKIEEFAGIFLTFKNLNTIFYQLIMVLYSFFLIFSTLSMFLTGGKITIDAFENALDIPKEYSNINFNDFGSSFLSCFCLTMVNNINIIARSLSYKCRESYKAYFATFYFMSTLIIINICQTILIEMYLAIKSKNLI